MKNAQGIMMDRQRAVNGKQTHRSSTCLNGIKISPCKSYYDARIFSTVFSNNDIHTYINEITHGTQ